MPPLRRTARSAWVLRLNRWIPSRHSPASLSSQRCEFSREKSLFLLERALWARTRIHTRTHTHTHIYIFCNIPLPNIHQYVLFGGWICEGMPAPCSPRATLIKLHRSININQHTCNNTVLKKLSFVRHMKFSKTLVLCPSVSPSERWRPAHPQVENR
jgi:hypothetical protein